MGKNIELEQLVINKLTQAQYDALAVKNPGELYFITDANPTKEVEAQLAELSEKVPEPISTYESFPEAIAENVGMRVVYTGETIDAPYIQNEDGSVSTVFLDPYLTRGHTFMLVPVKVLTSETESITIYMWQDVIGAIPPFDYDMAGQVLSTNGMGYEWIELPEDAVSSVNGRTGNVVITKDDLDLSEYVKNTDYATGSKSGVIKVGNTLGTSTSSGYLNCLSKTLENYKNDSATTIYSFISKGTLENIKNDLVKRAVTENDITLIDEEKTAARTWIGAISDTDYAGTDGSPGTFRPSVSYGTQMVASGYLRAHVDTLEDYKTRGVNFFIGKGTLENIKDDYIKRGLTENALTFTDDEKAKARTLIGAGSQTDLNNKADDDKVVHLAGNETITDVKTFTLPDNIKFTASKTVGYTPSMTNATSGATPATNVPWSRNGWHDHFAFGQSFTIFSKEVSTDGETWGADDRDVSYLFAQKEYGNTGELVLAPNAGEMGFRFVLQSANIAYSSIQWIEIGFAYTEAHTVRLLVESSPDGTEWTEVHNSTTGASATNKYLYVGNLSTGNTYLRISIIKTDAAYLEASTRMLYVKGWTTRKGNQGRGIEFEKPYFWDNVPNLMPIKSSGCNLGSTQRKWDAVYATKLNNGADLIIPSKGGTLALQSKVVALTANTVELATNTIYNAGELAALTITLPATTDSTYISQLNFTSGATATAFTAPDTIKWAGDDTDGAFVPMANKRYAVMFYSDNVNIRAIVQGVE